MKRIAIALAAAALLAGFTVQDAEKALDGEWAGMSFPIALAIDGPGKTATLTEAGKAASGPFKIESVSAGAATVSIGSKRYVLHIRDGGKRLLFAPIGATDTAILNRVR